MFKVKLTCSVILHQETFRGCPVGHQKSYENGMKSFIKNKEILRISPLGVESGGSFYDLWHDALHIRLIRTDFQRYGFKFFQSEKSSSPLRENSEPRCIHTLDISHPSERNPATTDFPPLLGFIGLAQDSSMPKYKIMTSAKERDKAKETCTVASWERDRCSEAYGGGKISLTNCSRAFCLNKATVSLGGQCETSSQVIKPLTIISFEICNFLQIMKLVP